MRDLEPQSAAAKSRPAEDIRDLRIGRAAQTWRGVRSDERSSAFAEDDGRVSAGDQTSDADRA